MKEGGNKFDGEKLPLDLLPPEFLRQTAAVLAHGAKKYGRWNWREGIRYSRVVAAVLRHLVAWLDREDIDEESGLPHLAHAACGIAFLVQLSKERPELDDRWLPLEVESD